MSNVSNVSINDDNNNNITLNTSFDFVSVNVEKG